MTEALHFDASVYYLNSSSVRPYGTATSVLIDSNSPLSMYNVTAKLNLLLKHVQVSSLRVEGEENAPPLSNASFSSGDLHSCGIFDNDSSRTEHSVQEKMTQMHRFPSPTTSI